MATSYKDKFGQLTSTTQSVDGAKTFNEIVALPSGASGIGGFTVDVNGLNLGAGQMEYTQSVYQSEAKRFYVMRVSSSPSNQILGSVSLSATNSSLNVVCNIYMADDPNNASSGSAVWRSYATARRTTGGSASFAQNDTNLVTLGGSPTSPALQWVNTGTTTADLQITCPIWSLIMIEVVVFGRLNGGGWTWNV